MLWNSILEYMGTDAYKSQFTNSEGEEGGLMLIDPQTVDATDGATGMVAMPLD